LRTYQQTGFVVYARRPISFQDPREHGILPGAHRATRKAFTPVSRIVPSGRTSTPFLIQPDSHIGEPTGITRQRRSTILA